MSTRVLFAILLGVLTVLRWLWLAPQDLPPSGAYLALCGYAPAVAYFDGPGATAMGEEFDLPLVYDAEADAASWEELKALFAAAL